MSVQVSRILHAGYIFENEGTQILFDPIFENPFSQNCYAFPEVKFELDQIRQLRPDAVFISHFHDDHCSFESLQLLDRETSIYMYCVHPEIFGWLKELGFSKVHSLILGEAIQIGSFKITTHRALDAEVDSIFQIQVENLNILNVVDSWIGPDTMVTLQTQKWDLILWPFQTMKEMEVLSPSRAENKKSEIPKEWLEQIQTFKPKFLVPSSCQFQMEKGSWYNQAFFPISYQFFSDEIIKLNVGIQVVRLNPGRSFSLDSKNFEPIGHLSWVTPVGEQNVDYTFDPQVSAPSTQQVARNLGILSPAQKQKVLHFCQTEISTKHQEIGPSSDPYFQKTRHWKLSVFDADGTENVFYYRLDEETLDLLSEKPEIIEWITEIPTVKLFGALFEGESLTSLYVRINDQKFSADLERQLADVDLIEDPLLRCLFNRSFGSYQQAQLARINSLQKP